MGAASLNSKHDRFKDFTGNYNHKKTVLRVPLFTSQKFME